MASAMASASRFWRYARSPYAVATVAIGATSALGTSHGVFGANADPASEKPRTTTEPFTAIDFPHEKQCASGSDDSRCVLVGTAVRCMMGLCHWKVARAYAVGVYVEESNFLQQWEGAKDRAIASSAESEDELHKDIWYKLLETDAGASRELILVMDQDVKGEHIAHGFDRSLLTRVRKAQGGKKGPIKNALKDFTQIFKKQAMLRKGTQAGMTASLELVWNMKFESVFNPLDTWVCAPRFLPRSSSFGFLKACSESQLKTRSLGSLPVQSYVLLCTTYTLDLRACLPNTRTRHSLW
mmetsp:Transcript_13541/g.26036  ORF Transcript_13541/g.26036 Transcript_13541/m.26036 type:complete len:297 (-) Transcript_13541:237-1127(-)